jgi:hypothetical protein
MDKDYGLIRRLLGIYSPQLFDMDKCTYELYVRCSTIAQTRSFGWGLPSTLIPPIADSFNHAPVCDCENDVINKRLHQSAIFAKDDIIMKYLHNYDWKTFDSTE